MRPATDISHFFCGSSAEPGDHRSLDIVRPSNNSITKIERTLPATGQEGEGESAATGQAVGATLSLPGLKMVWPSSQLILEGVKTVEARPYALGNKHVAQPGVEMWLVETLVKGHAVFDCWLFVDGAWVSPMPKKAQIVGTGTFSGSDEYGSLGAF